MNKSESIANLAAALSKTQGEMESAKKDSENPYFKSRYSDLAAVYDACRGPLAANGLAIVQMPVFDTDGRVGLSTVIMHSSGEWLECPIMSMRPVKDGPQELGSCLTYLRRYCLSATVGISSELDDDGNSASGKSDKPVTASPVTFKRPSTDAPAPAEAPVESKSVVKRKQAMKEPEAPAATATVATGEASEAFIPLEKQDWLRMKFKDALAVKYQSGPIGEQLRKGWLKSEGFIGPDGEGSSKMIPEFKFSDVARRLILWARAQGQDDQGTAKAAE